jgi:CheY-like chemotaxis protein
MERNHSDVTVMDTHPLRILVVEDNADGREMLRILLELLGHEVIVASDGQEGVEKAHDCHPDIAIVDIGLPLMDGYEVGRQLRRDFGRDLFLITQSGYGRLEDRQKALAAGFDVHLTKPVAPAELITWIEAANVRVAERKRGNPAITGAGFKSSVN